jgi:hypothetical protein
MADNNAIVPAVPIDMAQLNITYDGQNGDLADLVPFDSGDGDLKQMAEEVVRAGGVPGIDAHGAADFSDFVVDRFAAGDEVPYNRLFLRPKTPFGSTVTLTFKTPDVVDQLDDELDGDELEEVKGKIKKWVEYGEYVYIDFDLNKNTATVREV